MRRWFLSLTAVGVLGLGWNAPRTATAQSITRGGMSGVVVTAAGNPMWDARVVLTDQTTGARRAVTTAIDGRFAFHLLAPGDYEIRIEKIGYQPKRLVAPVRPRRTLTLAPVSLPLVQLPVSDIVEEPFSSGAAAASRIGTGQWIGGQFGRAVPGERRTLADILRFSGFGDGDFRGLGLPAGQSSFVVDGVGVTGVRHAQLDTDPAFGSVLPLSGFDGAEVIFNGTDVEFGGSPGALVLGYPRRGTRDFEVSGFADISGDPLSSASGFTVPTHTSARGAFSVSGPIVRDTTHFVAGIEWVRTESPQRQPWQLETADGALLAAAQDSFGVDLGPFTRPSVSQTNVVSGFGRVDAWLGEATAVTVTAGAAVLRDTDVDLGVEQVASLGSTVEGLDVVAIGTIASGRSGEIQQEFRLGFETSEREYFAAGVPSTEIVENGIRFGFDRALPGTFRRTAVTFNETFFGNFGRNNAKIGVGGVIASHDRTYAAASSGAFLFADVAAFARGDGFFHQAVGTPGATSFSSSRFHAYAQNTWSPSDRVQLSLGMRVDLSWLPTNRVVLNTDWFNLTGLTNNGTEFAIDSAGNVVEGQRRARWRFSPRVGLAWDLGPNREWTVNGGLGLFVGDVDPGVATDLMVRDGVLEMRRGMGGVGGWPAVPDSTVAPVQGPLLAVMHPEFEAPRAFNVSLGIARDLGNQTAFYVAGVYRHVDFLPRIQDLNRPALQAARDQHNRSVWGQLVQQNGLLATVPGSNRQFQTFDRVTAINPDGFSDYVAVTIGLDRQLSGAARFAGQYTYSRTTDNWLGAGLGSIDRQLSPFPMRPGGDWAEGTADLDVPHRVVAALVLGPGGLPFELAAFYRFASGLPFTPGFPDGVDVNGDGSGFNDPAFIDQNAPGMDALLRMPCLNLQRGQFAERNSCRAPGTHRLDLRLKIPILDIGNVPVSIVADALNLVASETGLIDRAVYRIDPAGSVTTSADGRTVTLPLVVNPDFGQFRVRTDRGRFARVGIRWGVR